MVTERASCQFERGRGHDYTRRKRTVSESLTVAAMAIQHRERSCHAFVTNRAARTAALIRNFHCTLTHPIASSSTFPRFAEKTANPRKLAIKRSTATGALSDKYIQTRLACPEYANLINPPIG